MCAELNPLAWVNLAPAIKGLIIFSKVAGSHSHNLATPTSDVDYIACYAAQNRDLLSMDPPAGTIDGHAPDFTVHEVSKFCTLLLKGNPNIIEMLFTDKLMVGSPAWEALRAARKKFLCIRTVKEYLGYCSGQLRKLAAGTSLHTKGGKVNSKWGYHMVRLANDALRIAKGGEPQVWKEGAELAQLMEIRRGEWSKDRIEKYTLGLINTIDGMKPWNLPEQGDKEFLNNWLLEIRGFKGSVSSGPIHSAPSTIFGDLNSGG